jgi:hypothetical protein
MPVIDDVYGVELKEIYKTQESFCVCYEPRPIIQLFNSAFLIPPSLPFAQSFSSLNTRPREWFWAPPKAV